MATDASVPRERLRRIEAVTDTALGELGVEEMLVELLDRVRDLLEVDTAAVLLLDPSAQYLVATAARGIEEEVRQGVRIPFGQGFAGQVAAMREAVYVDEVDHEHVLNPILWEKGIQSLLGVPLMAAGEVIGVLHVGSLSPRAFTDDETELLRLAGERVALATQTRQFQVSRAAGWTLQRSLLPARLPLVPGLEFGARYVPGGGGDVGGDWYDVFDVPSGHTYVVVGDVMGRGITAAVTMGRLRTALRGYALQTPDPSEVLTQLDAHTRHFEPGVMATVLCAVVSPGCDELVVSCAGHPPPVAIPAEGDTTLVELPPDLPVGIGPVLPRHTKAFPLEPGHGLLLYTDGLIERRGISLDVGFDRLCAAARPGPADAVCGKVMFDLLGAEQADDDVALLALFRLREP